MDEQLNESVARLRRRVLGMFKLKALWVLICVGIMAFSTAVQILDPVPLEISAEQAAAEMAEMKSAFREGRQPNTAQFRPYDNFTVTNYLIPLFGIWILCKFARRRDRLPVSVFLIVAGLWFALSLVWSPGAELFVFPVLAFAPLHWFDPADPGTLVNLLYPVLAVVLAGGALWLIWRLLSWIAGWLDLLLLGRRGHPAGSSVHVRVGLAVSVLATAPVLWWLYDWIDGGSIPGPFALTVRGLFVVWALWLMTGAQISLAWPAARLPREETGFEHDPEYNEYILGG